MTINDLANALRGMPRDALLLIKTPDGLRELRMITPITVNVGDGLPDAATGRYALVLEVE
jgi:hypothetical protein